jgi:hypothetical protein
MDITAILRVDHGQVVPGRDRETLADSVTKHFPEQILRLADSLQPAIVSACGIDRVATEGQQQMDITAILGSDRCRVVSGKSSKIPGNSSTSTWTRKKFAGRSPSGGEKPGKTPVLGGRKRSKTHQSGVKTGNNGREDRAWLRGGRGSEASARRISECSSGVGRGELDFHQ